MKSLLGLALLALLIMVAVFLAHRLHVRSRSTGTGYLNPFDRRVYLAEWHTHSPSRPASPESGRVTLDHIRFLESERIFDNTIASDELAAVSRQIVNAVKTVGASGSTNYALLLQATLGPGAEVTIQLATQGEAPATELQAVLDALASLRLPRPISRMLPLQFVFRIGDPDNLKAPA